ncbi:DDE superfamily endonuclease [Paraburkholderia sp. BL23I1N1]|nr:DDE superfamily endonuclease [Paraburkholderia sp. BL23I1N1]
MENVLDVYHRPYDATRPVVCMDETPRQLIRQTREPIKAAPGRPAREDYEYERCGVCNVFMASEPLAGLRLTKATDSRTRVQWSRFVQDIAQAYPDAQRITLVMDNLNTHTAAAPYETFPPSQAKALWDRFEFVYTPKHGSWLNMAEIELNVMIKQCLDRRIDNIDTVANFARYPSCSIGTSPSCRFGKASFFRPPGRGCRSERRRRPQITIEQYRRHNGQLNTRSGSRK